jgi:hypothetical protein
MTPRRISRSLLTLTVGTAANLAYLNAGCGASSSDSGPGGHSGAAGSAGTSNNGSGGNGIGGTIDLGGSGGNGATHADGATDPGSHACTNLECQQTTCSLGPCKQDACATGVSTTVHGTVYDPAGKVPLYNVVVYVPNGEVPALAAGATCDRCDSRVLSPVVSTLTDTQGRFTLTNVPVGYDIPLVMQVGKWRRQIKIPQVTACAETAMTDLNQTRLPRNKAEGDIPLIAITTGGADSMECLPRRMGIDDAEFTTDTGSGRIHLYHGGDNLPNDTATPKFGATLNGGASLSAATTLWADVDHLKKYDIVILSCEGALLPADKPVSARKAMYDYESLGGRVFASHWQRLWFSDGPAPVPSIGTWHDYGDPPSPITATIDTSFPKGQALSEWLVNVGASTTAGQLQILKSRDNIQSVNPALARPWITVQAPTTTKAAAHTAVEYLSYNAPLMVPDAQQCGRAVYNDLHVSATGGDRPGDPFPDGCQKRDLTAQEKAVEFMLFDLSSCVQNDDKPPVPPVPVVN